MLGIFGSFLVYLFAHFALSFLAGGPVLPEWMLMVVKGFSLLGFLLIFVTSLAAGWRIGTIIDLNPNADKVKARERALNYFVAAVIVNALVVGGLGFYVQSQIDETLAQTPMPGASATQDASEVSREVAAMDAKLHKIVSADANDPGGDTRFINIEVALDGTRYGEYRLEGDVSERVHNALLLRLNKTFIAMPGPQTVRLTIDRNELRDAYAQKVLGQSAQKMDIIGDFSLGLRLIPVLNAEETQELPDFVMDNMRLGKSPLIRFREISVRIGLKFQ